MPVHIHQNVYNQKQKRKITNIDKDRDGIPDIAYRM